MTDGFVIENGVLTRYSGSAHSIVIPACVHTVGAGAFKGMSWITAVTLPEGIREIGDHAFKGCRLLSTVNFPEGLARIGDFAFHRCHSLTSVILPDSVTELGLGAFLYCDSLRQIQAFGVRQLRKQTFANDTELRDIALHSEIDCSNFGDDLFTGCIRIQRVRLSDGFCCEAAHLLEVLQTADAAHPVVRAIAESVYHSLEIENGVLHRLHIDLRAFELPEGIRCIGRGCFFDKKGIVSITFPNSLERICTNAFGNCINLEQITLQSEAVSIDEGAFRGCSNLKRVVLGTREYRLGGISGMEHAPYLIRQINDQVMSDFYISGRILMSYRGREERVTVPDGIEIIGEGCFAGNDTLDRVIMSNTVREVHENAFRGCICMQSVVMSESLRVICSGAFEQCRRLIRFNVPAALESVGFAAFRGCKSLEVPGFETGTPHAEPIAARKTYQPGDFPAYGFCGDESVTELTVDRPCVIGKYAFSACPNLRTVVIRHPECVIEAYAFEKCPALRSVSVLAGSMEKGAFSFCRSLEAAQIGGVGALPDELFAGCSALSTVTVSETVTAVGSRCFDECTALTGFDFANIRAIGPRAFERCDSLAEVRLTGCAVGYHAFADCAGLRTVALDPGTVLQSGAFFGCTCADTVEYDGVRYAFSRFAQSRNTADNPLPLPVQEVIGSVYACFTVSRENSIEAYHGDAVTVRIPDDLTGAEDEAFRDHLRVTEILFPQGFRKSGKLTFAGTGWLEQRRKEVQFNLVNGMLIDAAACGESAVITPDIRRICSWAFAGNLRLRELTLTDARVIVDVFAFRNCINLKTVHTADGKTYTLSHVRDLTAQPYPELVRRIFTECLNCFKLNADGVLEESTGNLRELVFPGGICAVGDQVYMDCNLLERIVLALETVSIGKSAFKNSKWLQSVEQAGSLVRIAAQAFSGCRSLARIDLSDSLVSLGKRAFEHCCSLGEIHLSDQLTVIPEKAFFRCKSLRRVIIPASVVKIESQAFAFCSELEEVVFCGSPDIAEDAFAWCDKL
jgi:hypothetical protein